jgi:hypothetical protein
MTLPPAVSKSVRYHATAACSNIVGGVYSCTKPVNFYCLFTTIIIKRIPLINRILITRILINRIVLRCAYAGSCMVRPLALQWHINTIPNCAFPAFAGGLD